MADYDNTNRGAAFAPYDDQDFILQGRLDVDGDEARIAVIKQPLKKGSDPVLIVYKQVAILYPNEDKKRENSPDYSGPMEGHGNKRVAAWRQTSDRAGAFLSLQVSEPTDPGERRAAQRDLDDEIPF